MNILGLSIFGKNPSAALLVNGKLKAFVEEERFTRVKSADGDFPIHSIIHCLSTEKIKISDVDEIAIGWDFSEYKFKVPLFLAKKFIHGEIASNKNNLGFIELLSKNPNHIKSLIKYELTKINQEKKLPPISFFSHHLSHAASSFYSSGFGKSLILVMDGSGEMDATSVYLGNGNEITKIKSFELPNSLGWFYSSISSFLGFKAYEEDGFLMGLASYGEYDSGISKKIDQLLEYKDGEYHVDHELAFFGKQTQSSTYGDKLIKVFGKPRLKDEKITQYHKNLAFAAQEKLEKTVLSLANYYSNLFQVDNVCLAGGVSLNVKTNMSLFQIGSFKNIFIQPVSHDAGVALGAAQLSSLKHNERAIFPMDHVYYGTDYKNAQIKKVLDNIGVRYQKVGNISELAAEKISGGEIVAWFQGKMEVGPRALGNRSLLANPLDRKIWDKINSKIKYRDPWRPFCPSLTKKAANELIDPRLGKESYFMGCAHQVSEDVADKIPAVVHVDKSTRPQLVLAKTNKKYHLLLENLGQITGHEIVLNTSLNVKGEPIAESHLDALRFFYSTGTDYLAIGDFWIKK